MNTAHIADFLCSIADSVGKPRAHLRCARAALSALYEGYGLPNLMRSEDISRLCDGLVKAGTDAGRVRSKVMPIKPFHELFSTWPSNEDLSIKDLRLKSVTLLALAAMLRPSDIAPRGVKYDPINNTVSHILFNRDQVQFNDDGSALIKFLGTKNDGHRDGFEVLLPCHQNAHVDPVKALQVYMLRTSAPDNAVFVSLTGSHKAVEASTIGSILEEAIKLAGLAGQGYSAKSFRPTGATAAIEAGHDPDIVMKMGRWKTRGVFFEHYVHSRTPASFSADIIDHG